MLVVAPMALLGAACLPTPPPWVGDGPHVVVFGDSQTYALEHGPGLDDGNQFSFLTDDLVADGYAASVSALIGAETGDLAKVVPKIPEPGADIMLIALGSNDMRVDADAETSSVPLATAIEHVTTAAEQVGAGCTIVVTIAETAPWGLDRSAPGFNQALRSIPGVVVADWAPLVQANPHYVGEDGVHQTEAGVAAYRNLFHEAIGSCGATL